MSGFIVQCLLTDGLESPEKAVKIEVLRDEMPGVNYLRHLEAQVIGQYRVQYQEWASGDNATTLWRSRERHPARDPLLDGGWHTVAEAMEAEQRRLHEEAARE